MGTFAKLLTALLNAVPLLIQIYREWQRERRVSKQNRAIQDDPYNEWSNRFGQLRDDTYSDPAARCLCDTPIDCDPLKSPCMGGGGVSTPARNDKTTEVH